MSAVEMSILSMSEYVMFLMLATRVLAFGKQKLLRVVLFLIVPTVITYICNSIIADSVLVHVIMVIVSTIWLKLYSRIPKWHEFMSFYVIVLILIYAIQTVGIIVVSLMDSGFYYSFWYGLLSQTSSVILTCLVCISFKLDRYFQYFVKLRTIYKVILTNIYLCYFALSFFWFAGAEYILREKWIIILLTVVTIGINLLIRSEIRDEQNEFS